MIGGQEYSGQVTESRSTGYTSPPPTTTGVHLEHLGVRAHLGHHVPGDLLGAGLDGPAGLQAADGVLEDPGGIAQGDDVDALVHELRHRGLGDASDPFRAFTGELTGGECDGLRLQLEQMLLDREVVRVALGTLIARDPRGCRRRVKTDPYAADES